MDNSQLRKIIDNIYDGLESNNFDRIGEPDIPMYGRPAMGVSRGDDEYFEFLKGHIGEFHWSPIDAWRLKYDDDTVPSDLRVVSLIFPQSGFAKAAQKKEEIHPSDEWLVSRGKWEGMMREFSGKLVAELEEMGLKAVSIDLQSEWGLETSENLGIASRWSHRHYAYAAGLGTFGLSDGFISDFGKAVRITSLIVNVPLDTTSENRQGPYDRCLFHAKGICGMCIKRCPCNAISEEGHNKDICAEYEDICIENYWPPHIEMGDWIFGCGLCQVKVPCQDKNPMENVK